MSARTRTTRRAHAPSTSRSCSTPSPSSSRNNYLGTDTTLALTRDWVMEDKASFLPTVLNNPRSSMTEVGGAVRRFHHLLADGAELSPATLDGIHVGLIRRFLTDQLDFISVAKKYIQTDDFIDLIDHVIHSDASHGKLGGKSAGLFLAAAILRREDSAERPIGEVKVPRSWYIGSEGLMSFIEYNDLDEVLQQKYREISQVRQRVSQHHPALQELALSRPRSSRVCR